MRKKFTPPHVLAIVIALLLFSSCAKDFLSNSDNRSGRTDIGEAKSIFESRATDLREIDFGLSLGDKSTKCIDRKSVITPQWSKPFIVTTDKFTIFEVPLGGDVKKYASTQYRKDGVARRSEVKKVTTKLILKKNNETGDYIYFIATMVGRNEDKNVKDINYTNNRSFTGHIFISDLNGLCVGIYSCHSGLRQRSVFSRPTTKSAQNHEMVDGAIVQMFSTPAAAYSFGETGGGDGGGGIVMNRCSSCGQPQTGTFCLNCNSVITTPDYCRKCNGPYNNCYCCFICGNYPCTCYSPTNNCSYCGSYYCNGECRNVCYYCGSRSCSGSCQSSGGGGGGTTDPEESCGDVKCPTCGKCLNPTKPNCVKCSCCEHTLRCQSPGCGKLIRTNTRVGMNCSHVESDFCPSSGPACECGERHVDSEGNPLCSSAIVKKEMCETKEKAYPIMWTHTVKTNTEIAAAIVNKGMVIIEYNDENSATGCYINVTTCKKTGEKYIRYDGIRERLYHTGHIHTHPFVDTTKIENGSIRAKTLLSMADAGIPAKFGDAYIVYSGLVFQYYDQSFNNNSLCPIIHNF